jgi:hypothetical protein
LEEFLHVLVDGSISQFVGCFAEQVQTLLVMALDVVHASGKIRERLPVSRQRKPDALEISHSVEAKEEIFEWISSRSKP